MFKVSDEVVVNPEQRDRVKRLYCGSTFSSSKSKLGQDFANGKVLKVVQAVESHFILAESMADYRIFLALEGFFLAPADNGVNDAEFFKML